MRILVLVQTQLLELRRNSSLLILPILVLLMSGLYTLLGPEATGSFLPALALLTMAAYMMCLQMTVLLLAEERERRTLEALLLTPVRPLEVIAAKGIATVGIAAVIGLISLEIVGTVPAQPGLLAAGYGLAVVYAASLGTLLGLLVPDIRTAGVAGGGVMIPLFMGTALPWDHIAPRVWQAQVWLPTRAIRELLLGGLTGEPVPVALDLGVMLGHLALVLWLAARLLRRQAYLR